MSPGVEGPHRGMRSRMHLWLCTGMHLWLCTGLLLWMCTGLLSGCGPCGLEPSPTPPLACELTATPPPPTPSLEICQSPECLSQIVLNEAMSSNDGAWVDEVGQTDDWIELYNPNAQAVSLEGLAVSDRVDAPHVLTELTIPAAGHLLLWADDDQEQGPSHLPFKLSSQGEQVWLFGLNGTIQDTLVLPALLPNESVMRVPDGVGAPQVCAFATALHPNGTSCGPPEPQGISDSVAFCPFVWPVPFPAPAGALAVNEVRWRTGGFVELVNLSAEPVSLSGYHLRVAPSTPGRPWPSADEGVELPIESASLSPGAYLTVPLLNEATAALTSGYQREGSITLFSGTQAVSRAWSMSWPETASLARIPDATGTFRYCQEQTPGSRNAACTALESRPVGTWLRALQSPGDFQVFGAGDSYVGTDAVKVIVDRINNHQVYFLDSDAWDLHYTFVREVLEGLPHLDRCDPEQAAEFNAGWGAFSQENYYTVEGRSYLLGTLVHYGSNDLWTLEVHPADEMSAAQMQEFFFAVMEAVEAPQRWIMRASDADQIVSLQSLMGAVPAVGPDAVYEGMTYQPLNEGVTYGVLEYLPADVLETSVLSAQTLVLTDAVPLDIDLVAGLITEAFQTPLSHVAVLSKNRGTPNMAQVDAHTDPRVAPFLGKLVRLEVGSGGFSLQEASADEAAAFWEAQANTSPPLTPERDLLVRGIQELELARLDDLPAIGAKAAQLGELKTLARSLLAVQGSTPIQTPRDAFAIPLAHYQEHFEASGAAALLADLEATSEFQADPGARAEGLDAVRALILEHPVDVALVAEVEAHVMATFGSAPVRFRSSSNTEDIPGFSGAGLYVSVSGQVGNPDATVEDAMRTVWSSLWGFRAYEERHYYHVSQQEVGMGILCHEAFQEERANGVSISRNILDPTRSAYYTNAQFGEASVTNPAPGIEADALLYRWGEEPPERYLGYSSFLGGVPVLSAAELLTLNSTLQEIHNYFRSVLDPTGENAYFAMDIEWKLLGDERSLLVKQARPYSYGRGIEDDCP